MKKSFFFVILLLATAHLTHGQMGRYGTMGGRQSAVPRSPQTPPKEEKPKTAEELVAEQMPKISEVLELNEFEQAVVSSILTKYVQQRIELQILELPREQTMRALEKIAENQKQELEAGLPPEKYEAFLELQENGFKKSRKKKKKKKKDKT